MGNNSLAMLLGIPSIIAGLYTIWGNVGNSSYNLLFLLPFTYAACVFASGKTLGNLKHSIVYLTFVLGAFIRLVISPVLMTISRYVVFFGYYETFLSSTRVEAVMPETILLMSYENICLFFALSYAYSEKRNWNKGTIARKIKIINGSIIYRMTIVIMIGVVLFALYRFPSYSNYVGFVWKNSLAQISNTDFKGDSSSFIYRLFIWFVDILQLLLPITIAIWIKGLRISFKLKTILFLPVLFLTLVVMTDNKIVSIVYSLLLIVWYYRDYGGIPKKWFLIIGGIGIFAIVALLEKNLFNMGIASSQVTLLSGTVNGYFEGPYNVAASLLIRDQLSFDVLFGDIVNAIPFLPIFFKEMPTTKKLFNYLIKGTGAVETKVIPLIGQGAFYLSPLFAPIVILIVVFFARKWELRSKQVSDNVDSFIFSVIAMFAALSPSVFNGTVLIKNVCNVLIVKMLVTFRRERMNKEIHYGGSI